MTPTPQNWEGHSRVTYTVLCFLLQFLLPTCSMALAYARYYRQQGTLSGKMWL